MGRIDDNRRKREDTKGPLSEIGNRNIKTNDFDIYKKTIKDQKNKK